MAYGKPAAVKSDNAGLIIQGQMDSSFCQDVAKLHRVFLLSLVRRLFFPDLALPVPEGKAATAIQTVHGIAAVQCIPHCAQGTQREGCPPICCGSLQAGFSRKNSPDKADWRQKQTPAPETPGGGSSATRASAGAKAGKNVSVKREHGRTGTGRPWTAQQFAARSVSSTTARSIEGDTCLSSPTRA